MTGIVPWLTLGLSVLTIGGTAINVYVGLRLAALQLKTKADAAALELSLLKQFVAWKDEVLQAINGKYVSATLVAEIRSGFGRELALIQARLDHIDHRCEERIEACRSAGKEPPSCR